ncbi:MAG TPA: transglycosylase SLT domain-containing protein [Rhodanobacteraceae bacterium]|nr:transglycosylase SLT domain-containing protein [Rhodanobacteraceae bacterium]
MTARVRLLLPSLGALLLGACATTPRTPMVTLPPPSPAPVPVRVTPARPVAPPGFWQELRSRFAFASCSGSSEVDRWIRRYSAQPQRFEAAVKAVLPELRYVARVAREHDVPGEFVWLPWVESSYRLLPPRGRGAAGLWQLMPRTARSLGLRVDHRYDARLDLEASSTAAMQLLRRYQRTFHDWRLSDMAYNAGMYGIKRLLRERGRPLDDAVLPDLPVRPVTRSHLAKLMALACIVREPQQYDIELPAVDERRTLVAVSLPAPLSLHVAARLAGVPVAHLRELNLANRSIDLPVTHLVLERGPARRFDTAYARLEPLHWQRWQRVRLAQASSLQALVGKDVERQTLLAQVNRLGDGTALPRHTALWLPQDVVASLPGDSAVTIDGAPLSHRVVSGDTLWDIAHRFHLRVSELRSWNHLRGDLLHLGQVLRLTAP